MGNTRVVFSVDFVDCCNGMWNYVIESAMDYYPYGKTLREYQTGVEKYLTTQHERDAESGLDYRGARFYDSDVARFLSLDPLAAEYVSWSAYNYVLSNPVLLIDPNCMSPFQGDGGEKGPDLRPDWQKAKDGLEPGGVISGGATVDDEWEISMKNGQEVSRRWISNKGGDAVDYVRVVDVDKIPQKAAFVDEFSVPVQHTIHNSEVGPAFSKDIGVRSRRGNISNESLDLTDFIPVKGASKFAAKLGFSWFIKLALKEGGAQTSGWVARHIFKSLDPAIQKKVASAIGNGIVAPTGKQGIIKLTATEAAETGYQYKIKILGVGGDIRIYGNAIGNGHIYFNKIMGH